ncbi:carbohydrate ABC transporter substrate-binding protein (CUT1 family) [Actinocorallia herbida]|uniref:Carbohydrate ABC transporter substrate-binding protein (CUT1 family) n=1 Tax=Actinocorallia herbida TaxID=58109 RepID=A0A3N1DCL6_9ACTN|nr:ABC transporter substrate-binding protein [Actinocorallia herbida]ROO91239.1 carbohydrate ABC transporter substrate-binding protein (CUT1 family) [Actinocorallia herbida]
MRWGRRSRAVLCAVLAAGAAGCGGGSGGVPVVNLYNAPQENLAVIVERCDREAKGAYRIALNTLPRGADDQREQLVRRLAAGDPGLDVLGLDVTWTAELAEAGWIREWKGAHAEQAAQGTLKQPLETARWHGALYAAPYTTNVQLLWYRSDLMPEPPATWDGLMKESARLAGEGKPHYGEVTGAQYEGLVVWFNSLVESAGGSILSPDGEQVALGPPAERALGVMRAFARSKAADPSLSNTKEDDARLAVEGGRAAYELNWPFVYAAMAADRPEMVKHFKWAPYPGLDGPGRAPLGGANFAVSRFSAHPEAAFAAALCLRDPESQRIAATKDGLPPTIEAVYRAEGMAEAYPMRDAILKALRTAAPRPKTPTYQNVSTVTAVTLSPPAAIDPPRTLATLKELIGDALQSKGVLP